MSDERTITSQRIVPYTREQIFRAWTDPDLLSQWWGPNGFTNTFHSFELKPGGRWHFTMHGPDGASYENLCVFAEIKEPERIVFDHIEPVHAFRAQADFETQGQNTHIRFCMSFAEAREYRRVKDIVAEKNEENFDRLEAVLRKLK